MKRKQKVDFSKLRGLRDWTALSIATTAGTGLLPVAPGTWGTLASVPVVLFLHPMSLAVRLSFWFALFCLGVWAAKTLDQSCGTQDNPHTVIDETVGYGISAWTAGTDPVALLAAFLLFRFFDIVKPGPIRWVDQWSHRQARAGSKESAAWWTGFGVMADDVLAGFAAWACLLVLQHQGWVSGS
jgi:phosphatidylglycerophosphatase A